MTDFHIAFRKFLYAVNLRHGTDGFTSSPKEGVLRIFFALKNPTALAGFEPANLGTKGQHATSRPPKPLMCQLRMSKFQCLRENQNTHFIFNNFLTHFAVYVEEYSTPGQATDDNKYSACALHAGQLGLQTHTHNIRHLLPF